MRCPVRKGNADSQGSHANAGSQGQRLDRRKKEKRAKLRRWAGGLASRRYRSLGRSEKLNLEPLIWTVRAPPVPSKAETCSLAPSASVLQSLEKRALSADEKTSTQS